MSNGSGAGEMAATSHNGYSGPQEARERASMAFQDYPATEPQKSKSRVNTPRFGQAGDLCACCEKIQLALITPTRFIAGGWRRVCHGCADDGRTDCITCSIRRAERLGLL
jgi:hypothetical protein